ncbi:MAG TPA: uracil-DNA glycosylase [Candidatus Caenarcaniphilales bacterium]
MAEEQINLFELPGRQASALGADFNPDLIPTDVKVPIPPGTYQKMADLAQHCNQCQRCRLGATRTHAVVGRGSLDAPLMIVGEGPGQNEDETGLPFVGRAGQLLEKILESVKLDTDKDVYISNIVKCRPPGNRNPATDEAEACKPYILEQIRMVDPKIILLTGATALKVLTGDKRGITKIRGEWIEWQGRLCMPILHPAYLLRNPSRQTGSPKWLMWQDIQKVRSKLEELVSSSG